MKRIRLTRIPFLKQKHNNRKEETSVRSALRTLLEKDAYGELMNLIIRDPKFLLVGALFPIRQEMDAVAKSLVNLFMMSQSHLLRFIKYIVQTEINETPNNSWSELFRSNSIPTKILSDYTYQIGRNFLQKMLKKPLEYIYKSTGSFEVNPNRLDSSEDCLQENQNNLKKAVDIFLQSILQASKYCPKQIQQICSYLRVSVGNRFRSHADTAVGIVIPATFKLEPNGYSTNERIQRGLVLVAKMLQSLANNVLFGPKEPFMKIFNPFIRDNYFIILAFYDEICDKKKSSLTSHKPVRSYLEKDCFHDRRNLNLEFEKYHIYLKPIVDCINKNLDAIAANIEHSLNKLRETRIMNGRSFSLRDLNFKREHLVETVKNRYKKKRAISLDCCALTHHRIHSKTFIKEETNFKVMFSSKEKRRLHRSKSDGNLLDHFVLNETAMAKLGRVQSVPENLNSKAIENYTIYSTTVNINHEILQHRHNSIMQSYYSYISHRGLVRLLDKCNLNSFENRNPSLKDDNDIWKFWKEINGIQISRRRVTNGNHLEVRGSGHIKATPRTVYNFLKDINNRRIWDKMVINTREVEKIDDKKSIVYIAVAGPRSSWVISPRDLSYLVSFHEDFEDEDTFVIQAESVYRDDVPPVRGFVRMDLENSYFLIRPSKESRDSTDLVYIVQADPKGWFPTWLKNWACLQQALCVSSIRQIVELTSSS